MLRQGMVLPSVARSPLLRARSAGYRERPASQRISTGAISCCLRIALVFWSGLIAGVTFNWFTTGSAGDGVARNAVLGVAASDVPVFGIILWGAAFLHAVLAIESVCRWREAAARLSFVAAVLFLVSAGLIAWVEGSIGATVDGGAATRLTWLSGAAAATACLSFLFIVASFALNQRPAKPI